MTAPALPSGLYDLVLTDRLERLLAGDATARHEAQPLADDAAQVLADSLVKQLAALLQELPGDGATSICWRHRPAC